MERESMYYKFLYMTLIERVRFTMDSPYDELLSKSERLTQYYNLLSPAGQMIVDQVIEMMCGHKLSTLADPKAIPSIVDDV